MAAGAAAAILGYIYPDEAQLFLEQAQEAAQSRVLAGAHFPSDVAAGLELGQQVAQQVIARAQQDDTLAAWDGVIPTGDGLWTGENPGEPTAGQWQTWVLAASDEIRPGPPLAYPCEEWWFAKDIGPIYLITYPFSTWALSKGLLYGTSVYPNQSLDQTPEAQIRRRRNSMIGSLSLTGSCIDSTGNVRY